MRDYMQGRGQHGETRRLARARGPLAGLLDWRPGPALVYDWDLWPWMVADGYGGVMAVVARRFELVVGRLQATIGARLLPAFQGVADSVSGLLAELRSAA